MRMVLQREGYRVSLATNGEEAIAEIIAAQAKGHRIPIILLDIVMPIIDGIGVLNWLIEHLEASDQTRVIVISGASLHHLAEQHPVLKSPFVAGIFSKPAQIHELMSLVRSLHPSGD